MFSKIFKSFLKRFLYSISIRSRLLLYFIFLIFLPTSIISATIYSKSKSIITERVSTSIENNLNMAETSLNQKFEDINDILTLIYFAPELQAVLSSPNSYDKPALINEMSSLDKILNYYNISNPSKTGLFPKLYVYDRPEYHFYNFSNHVADLGQIENESWYKALPYQSRYAVVGLSSLSTSAGKFSTIKIAKRLYGLKGQQLPYSALLTMDVTVDEFNSIIKRFSPSPGSKVVVLDSNENIIISSEPSYLGKSFADKDFINSEDNMVSAEIDNIDMLISQKHIPQFGWTIISMSPESEMYGELVSFNKVMIIVLLICLILALIMAFFLSENVSYPIRKLSKSMSFVKDGNFDITLEYKRNDEFANLISSYKDMVSEIKELINKLYVSEINKKEAELLSLQAQINPHFLYNTLDSVNWFAIKHNVPEISTMVTYLSDFFRHSLNKGRNIIAVGDELKQVESYLAIQKIRFKDSLDYTMDISKEILNYYTIKLILQPIVENAILHGIGGLKRKGLITISGAKINENLEFRISDNGIGADIGFLNSLLEERAVSGKSYGIRNVNQRIKQTFGNEYGITFISNEDTKGIGVIIKIKAISTLEGFHDNNDNSR